MKYEQSVKDLYKIAGMLRLLTCMHERKIPPAMIVELEDAMDKLELIGDELIKEDQEPQILIKGIDIPVDHLDERPMKKVVKVHEGSEESPPEPQPADQ